MPLDQAAILQGVVAVGVAIGAVVAAALRAAASSRCGCCRSASLMGLMVIDHDAGASIGRLA